MSPPHATTNATFFYITDVRSTDRTGSADSKPRATSSSGEQPWKYAR